MRRLLLWFGLLGTLPSLSSATAAFELQQTSTNTNSSLSLSSLLPKGLTICDGSDPVGVGQAYLLQDPIPYCMNYGRCINNYQDHPEQPCLCSSAFTGPHCEFVKGTEPMQCTRHCFWGACQIGAKSFEIVLNSSQATVELQYCLCPDNAVGDFCERESQKCGDNEHCLNGGTCVQMELGGESTCDCTTAFTGPNAFAGRHCEHKVTTYCSNEEDSNIGRHFCVNGGTCRDGANMGCLCQEGFSGPLCEFKNEAFEYSECTLQCQNNGVCRKGAEDVSFLEKFGIDRHLESAVAYSNELEHCVCPRGFAGLTCEYDMEICPGRNLVCMHGGRCNIEHAGETTEITCDCTYAETNQYRFTGKYCEVRSTNFCTIDGEKTPSGPGLDAFCTNGGKCVDLVEPGTPHPGCICPQGYFGDWCEQESASATSANVIVAGVVAGLGAILIATLTIMLWRSRRKRRLRSMRRAYRTKGYCDAAPAPTLDHINQLEPWMSSQVNLRGDLTEHPAEGDEDASVSSSTVSEAQSSLAEQVTNATFHEHQSTGASLLLKNGRASRASASGTIISSDYSANTDFSVGFHLVL